MGSSEFIPYFGLIARAAFVFLIKWSVYQYMSFPTLLSWSPSHCVGVRKQLCGAELSSGIKPHQKLIFIVFVYHASPPR